MEMQFNGGDLTLAMLLRQNLPDHIKVICLTIILSSLMGVCRQVLLIIMLAIITGVAFLTASLLYRYVGGLLWMIIIITLPLYVHDVDTLLAWTLGFLFGILSVLLLSLFLNTALYRVYLICFAHVLLVMAGIYAKVDSMAMTSSIEERRSGLTGCQAAIWWCFSTGIMCGAFYTGIVEELTYYNNPILI